MARRMRRGPKRRTPPPWSLPTEIWAMLTNPLWQRKRGRPGLGLECSSADYPAAFTKKLVGVMTTVHHKGRTPQAAHQSRLVEVAKNNGKSGVLGLRLLHLLCPFWAVWHKVRWDEGPAYEIPHWAHGFEAGRRREDAIAVTMIAGEKLAANDYQFVDTQHDLTNAFATVRKERLRETLEVRIGYDAQGYFRQKVDQASTVVMPVDGDAQYYDIGSGVLMGDKCAPPWFNAAIWEDLKDWQYNYHEQLGTEGTALLTKCEMLYPEVDLALTVFADDIRQKQLVKSERPGSEQGAAARLHARICQGMDWLDAALNQGGFVQNSSKLEIIPRLQG